MIVLRKALVLITICDVITLSLIVGGCERKGKNIPINPPTVTTHMEDAWSYFKEHDYENAIRSFTAAKDRDALAVEAYNGLAWSYARTHEYLDAVSNFQIFLSLTDNQAKYADAFAGLAFINSATGEDSVAIAYVERTLNLDPQYEFEYDNKINAKTLRVLVVKCYCNMGDFLKAMTEVETKIESGYEQSLIADNVINVVEDDTAVVSIADIITGEASAQITKQVIVNSDTLEVDAELVKVVRIKAVDNNSEYTLTEFQQGGGEIQFFGNPILQKKDKVLVSYYYASDYGVFLSRLFQKIAELQG